MHGILRLNNIGRWEIVWSDGSIVELICGDVFEIETDFGMRKTRMEEIMGNYYTVDGFTLKDGLKATIF